MIWYMVAFLCAVSAFAQCMRDRQPIMATVMACSAGVSVYASLTS